MARVAVPLIVLSGREDDVEFVNRSLRDGGHPVRCHWITQLDALPGAIQTADPQLLCFFPDSIPAPIHEIAKIRQRVARSLPLVVVTQEADENSITDALLAGAQDLVSLRQTERLRTVAERELRAFRLDRALKQSLYSANQYKQQLKAFTAGSADAIAHVQEGIVTDANQAWAELFAHTNPTTIVGAPIMDLIDPASQAALKGALTACLKGQWGANGIKIAIKGHRAALPLQLHLELVQLDGEHAIKLSVPRPKVEPKDPVELIERAASEDPATGFCNRRHFVEELTKQLTTPHPSGVRALAYIRPDKFREIESEIGYLASEEVLIQLAELLGDLTEPQDIRGRFGGQIFTIFLKRGNLRDIRAWAQNAVARISSQVFEAARHTLSMTCSIGLAEVGPGTDRIEDLVKAAKLANQTGRQRSGNCVVVEETSDQTTRVQRFDEIWVQHIKAALIENRFKLMHLPIASLLGERKMMHDTLLRMIDPQGDEVGATEFMAAARRNRLQRAIDRWVIGASLAHCASIPLDCTFIKLSSESVLDSTLTDWLTGAVRSAGVSPTKLCFQVSEEHATQYLAQTQKLAEKLLGDGYRFAIENFGVGRDSNRILLQTPMSYLKLDGSLMQSLATDPLLQEKVRTFISSANKRNVPTIAERVENANTMAVLFQLGASYMQGHYVHEPEVVLGESATSIRV